MKIITINKSNRANTVKRAVRFLRRGGLVVAQADTSYALLVMPGFVKKNTTLNKIKYLRDRKLYSLFVPHKEDILEKIKITHHRELVSDLLPGQVTIVYDAKRPALRCIRKRTIVQLLSRTGSPLTATSANPSGLPPARTLVQLKKYFSDLDLLILYEGVVRLTLPSTIVDVSHPEIRILRQGTARILVV